MSRPGDLAILFAGGDPDAAATVAAELEASAEGFAVTPVAGAAAAVEALAGPNQCLVAEAGVLEEAGPAFRERVRAQEPAIPVVAFGPAAAEIVETTPLDGAVTDYVTRTEGDTQYRVLANRIRNAVERVETRNRAGELDTLRGALTDIAVDFLQAPGTDVDEQVNAALERIGGLANADRSYVFQLDGPERIHNTHEWTAPGIEAQIEKNQDYRPESLPWLYPRLADFETVVVPSVADLPPSAHEEQRIFRAQNVESLVVVPMISAGELVGFVGFDWVERRPELPEAVTDALAIIGELIANALELERQQAELQEVRDRWSLAQQAANLGVWDWDLRTDAVTFSESWAELLGETPSTIETSIDAWENRVHPDDLPGVKAALEAHFEGETAFYEHDHRMRTSDGEWLWTKGVGKVVDRDESGQPIRAVGIQRDIGDQKERELELEASKNAYQDLFDGIEDAVFVHEPEGPFLAVNETACERLGYTEAELLEMEPADVDSREHAAAAHDRIERIEADGTHTFETVHVGKSGVHIPVEVAASTIEYFGETAILSVARDISERKRRTSELQQYKRAVEGSTELLGAVDEHHRLRFANERFRASIGDDDPDPVSRHLEDYLGDDAYAKIEPHLERGLQGESGQFERTHTTADGEERALAVNYYPLESPDGGIEGVVAAIRDVTERKERQRELERQLAEIRRLSEYRRVMSAVNQRLVEFRDPETVLEQVVEIIAESEAFGGAIITRPGAPPIWSFADPNVEPTDAVSSDAYREAVFEAGSLRIEDLTGSPFQLVDGAAAGTVGWGLGLRYEEERFGVLTVQLPPSSTASEDAVELLEELAGDIGLFCYTQKIEGDLREREERLELALEGAELGVWDWDMTTDDVYRDERYERMLGYEPGTIDGTVGGWAAILHPDARETHDRALEKHVEGDADLYQCEYRLRTADDEWKWIRNIGKVLEWTEDGEPKRSVGVHQDIDDQRRTRERLKSNNELLQAIDRVLRHNLHNDLNIVQGYAQTIAESASGPIEYQAEKILESSEALLGTADKERRLTELVAERQTTESITLEGLLEQVADRVRRHYPAATVALDEVAETAVLAIPEIAGALEELIENGIVHTQDVEPTVRVRAEAGVDAVAIEISDDGPGIPEMERNVLTGQDEITPLYHGSGLGLWFVNIVVRRSDGEIAVEETGPGGSRIAIQLPRSE